MPPANDIDFSRFSRKHPSLDGNSAMATSSKGKGRDFGRSSRTSMGVTIEKESRGNVMNAPSRQKFLVRESELALQQVTLNAQYEIGTCIFLVKHCPFGGLQEAFKVEPNIVLGCLGIAISEAIIEKSRQTIHDGLIKDLEDYASRTKIIVRISQFEPLTHLKDLKANLIGRLICIRGTVVRTSSIKPIVTQMSFTCVTCSQIQTMHFPDGKYVHPTGCLTYGCKGRVFEPQRGVEGDTRTVDWQRIRIQEKLADDQKDSGRVPRTIECEVTNELVDSVLPGDVVSCAGIVKVIQAEDAFKGKSRASNTMHILYLDCIGIYKAGGAETLAESSEENDGNNSKDGIQFTRKDLQFIHDLFQENDLFKLLVNSLCPAIFGHELVKGIVLQSVQLQNLLVTWFLVAGLLLGLFGGRRRSDAKNQVSIRGDPHVLVVGDPGLGKSQMLSAVVQVAPRGVYVCGSSGISSSGLTVTLCKESGSNDFALEAGALVLGDQGCCCIDEFDKISADHNALLEAMEQQCISIAKAGIVCSLPARTCVIAAANPIGGHYNKAKTVSENLKMSSALLSRFDLIFILIDKPNEEMDMFLSEHVMALHSGINDKKTSHFSGGDPKPQEVEDETPLINKLKMNRYESLDLIPPSLLRKYIAYARKYVHPRLSKEACDILQDFYLTLRAKHRSPDSTPITTRQLESMIRLAEARARAELRETVTKKDATEVVEIMRYSLFETYKDEFGNLDFERSQLGTGMSKRSESKRFISRLQNISESTYNNRFTYQ
ncbi:MCM-domain-containing protein, partial [Basidiobolus meristosporus CBS 931.73]